VAAFDFTPVFARWMAATDYRDEYFRSPSDLTIKLETDFVEYAARQLRETLTSPKADENTVVAACGVASLYGFSRVSLLLKEVENDHSRTAGIVFSRRIRESELPAAGCSRRMELPGVPITLHSGGEL